MSKRRSARPKAPRDRLVVGVTGASGAAYAARLVEVAAGAGRDLVLIVTGAGRTVWQEELGGSPPGGIFDFRFWDFRLNGNGPGPFASGAKSKIENPKSKMSPGPPRRDAGRPGRVTYYPAEPVAAPPASGSFPAAAMVVIPCSMNTLAAIAHGRAENLLQRAAQVALKEGRPLVVVPREMPLTRTDLENMLRLADAGAVVMPAMPGFYHRPKRVADLVDFVVAKVLGRLGIEHGLDVTWPGADV
jgi:4-hydroxy-3-polyprenylbenzoate decarboxylase